MTDPKATPAMNQKIFQMGLSVETVSVYLLCCGLEESDTELTQAQLKEIWNGTAEQLEEGLKVLEGRGVIDRILSNPGGDAVFRLKPADRWQCH